MIMSLSPGMLTPQIMDKIFENLFRTVYLWFYFNNKIGGDVPTVAQGGRRTVAPPYLFAAHRNHQRGAARRTRSLAWVWHKLRRAAVQLSRLRRPQGGSRLTGEHFHPNFQNQPNPPPILDIPQCLRGGVYFDRKAEPTISLGIYALARTTSVTILGLGWCWLAWIGGHLDKQPNTNPSETPPGCKTEALAKLSFTCSGI